MNRMEEYQALLKELDQPVSRLETTLERAYQKKKQKTRKMLVQPIVGFTSCFILFVLLVNFCTPIAYACSKIPILEELAKTVTFSKSLSNAIENDYVQMMNVSQTNQAITAKIEYLIVDQKQVNIFYRLDSNEYTPLMTDPEVLSIDGTRHESCSYGCHEFNAQNGDLRRLSIDFKDENVPNSLRIKLKIHSNNNNTSESSSTTNVSDDIFSDGIYEEPNYLTEFDFLLEFDPTFTATGKIIPINQTIELEGQFITITNIEIYPTHMRINITEATDNTAWLTDLAFYIETDSDMKFEPITNGIRATGSKNSPSMISYRAESTYFYTTDILKLVITGAKWLKKDMETVYVNLITGESDSLPEGVTLYSAQKEEHGWIVTFRAPYDKTMYQLFGSYFYDKTGNKYEINTWNSTLDDSKKETDMIYYFEQFPLNNYFYDEVWLSPLFSHEWIAKEPIVIPIQ